MFISPRIFRILTGYSGRPGCLLGVVVIFVIVVIVVNVVIVVIVGVGVGAQTPQRMPRCQLDVLLQPQQPRNGDF